MSEPRLQNQLEYLAYKIGHIGWGYIFMYLDVNLGTIDILPSWAGYLFMMLAAVSSIVFKIMGREDLMMFCSGCVCLVLVLYWLSYVVLKKKY